MAFYNGVFGMFEDQRFEQGTRQFISELKRMKDAGVAVYVGGGEGGTALEKYGHPDWVTSSVFTAGGTVLNVLGLEPVPYLVALRCVGPLLRHDEHANVCLDLRESRKRRSKRWRMRGMFFHLGRQRHVVFITEHASQLGKFDGIFRQVVASRWIHQSKTSLNGKQESVCHREELERHTTLPGGCLPP